MDDCLVCVTWMSASCICMGSRQQTGAFCVLDKELMLKFSTKNYNIRRLSRQPPSTSSGALNMSSCTIFPVHNIMCFTLVT